LSYGRFIMWRIIRESKRITHKTIQNKNI